jgi:hypothetical protein
MVPYINGYYEMNINTGNATSYYYSGGQLIAMSENGTMKYYPFAVFLKKSTE